MRHFHRYCQALVSEEMMIKLISISFHAGYRGQYSKSVKMFLAQGIQRYIDGLEPRAKKAYQAIEDNIRLANETTHGLRHERGMKGVKLTKADPALIGTPRPDSDPEPVPDPQEGSEPSVPPEP